MSDNTKCDRCGGILTVSTTILAGRTVVGCRDCNRSRLDGDDQWIPGAPDAVDRLRARARVAGEAAGQAGVIDAGMGPDAAASPPEPS
jgi:hypothetical protein